MAVSRSDYHFGTVPVPYERPVWLSAWLLQLRGCFSRASVIAPAMLAERLLRLSFSLRRGQRLTALRMMLRDFGEVRAAKLGDRTIVLVNEQPADVAGELFWLRLTTALACFESDATVVWLGELAQVLQKNSYADLEQQLWLFDDIGQITIKQKRKDQNFLVLNNRSYLSTVERKIIRNS